MARVRRMMSLGAMMERDPVLLGRVLRHGPVVHQEKSPQSQSQRDGICPQTIHRVWATDKQAGPSRSML